MSLLKLITFRKKPEEELPIPSNGLILYLDAANPDSYPGSGTTWTDLSGNGNHGTLQNGVGYSASNDGTLVFDGINDRVAVNSAAVARVQNTNNTLITFVQDISKSQNDIMGNGQSAPGDYILMLINNKIRGHSWSSTNNANAVDSPTTFPAGTWKMVAQRTTWGGNIDIFLNGTPVNSKVLSGGVPNGTRTSMGIGWRLNSGNTVSHFSGSIAVVLVYNRALTNSQIVSIFNTFKNRYGL